ncbi:hypothetical protein [Nonomuraea deserti]|uniref:hypothetical protein n=1 Tax=Nonomuraea deserti TaxID=1848322 RepID=UPI001FE39D16|nr:hypothetical protein [Nonomuraea deserti]
MFVAVGVASAMVLYEPALAVIVAWFAGRERQRANALLALTIVAGFAFTIFLPLTGLLTAAHGGAVAVIAVLLVT